MPHTSRGANLEQGFVLVFIFMLCGNGRANEAPPILDLACGQRTESVRFIDKEHSSFLARTLGSSGVVLEIEEAGEAIKLDEAAELRVWQVHAPLRFGRIFVDIPSKQDIVLRRLNPSPVAWSFKATLHCSPSPAESTRLAWFKETAGISSKLQKPVDQDAYSALLDSIRALDLKEIDAREHALAEHLLAQAQLVNGHFSEANASFADAEDAWTQAGEPNRSSAARVGRLGSLVNSGKYQDALDLKDNGSPAEGETYYFTRAQVEQCLALIYVGRRRDAKLCYDRALHSFERMGEEVDAINTLQPLVGLLQLEGNDRDAETLAQQGIAKAIGPDAPLIRGRFEIVSADLLARRGAVSEAFSMLQAALTDFSAANDKRWIANTDLKLAALLSDLGETQEAHIALSNALSSLRFKDAPARMALAMRLFAGLEEKAGNHESARFWIARSETVYQNLKMPAELDTVRLQQAEMIVGTPEISEMERLLAGATHSDENLYGWKLISASIALKKGLLLEAKRQLEAAHLTSLSLLDRVLWSELEADYWLASGNQARAIQLLDTEARRIHDLASSTRSPVLGIALARQALPLRQKAFDIELERRAANDAGAAMERVWNWLAAPSVNLTPQPAAQRAGQEFDKAVATELFPNNFPAARSQKTTNNHPLLAALSLKGSDKKYAASKSSATSLANFRQHLPEGSAFVALLGGKRHGGLLWATRQQAVVLPISNPSDIRISEERLIELLKSPGTPLSSIDESIRVLSTQLLGNLSRASMPSRLYVFADETAARIPWSTLIWPGTSSPLADNTTIELVRLKSDRGIQAREVDRYVVTAPQFEQNRGLKYLPSAEIEAALVKNSLSSLSESVIVLEGRSATPQAVGAALAQSGAWVHIGAHGEAKPERMGYSGLWLSSGGTDLKPKFMSQFDILEKGIAADLVVLNACSLGDNGSSDRGDSSFASALSLAGARQVVSALWNVSDSATAIWVPSFYSALLSDPERDSATALRVAQMQLRASRHFAHPFFWAGMQSTRNMPLTSH